MARRLDLWMNGRLVGHLDQGRGTALSLSYAPDWLAWPSAFAVSVCLPPRETPHQGADVWAVLDGLLPREPGVRQALARQTGAGGTDALSLLEHLGGDCVGALQFFPAGKGPGPAKPKARPIADAGIGAVLRGLPDAPLGVRNDDGFRTALPWGRGHTALLQIDGDWLRPEGPTPTTHILRAQGAVGLGGQVLSNSVETDYLGLAFCRAMGAQVLDAQITDFDGTRALVLTRDDRIWGADGRLLRAPAEAACQALGQPPDVPGVAATLRVLQASDRVQADQAALVRAQLLGWLLGVADGDALRVGLALRPGGGVRLRPIGSALGLHAQAVAAGLDPGQIRVAMSWNGRDRLDQMRPADLGAEARAGGAGAALVAQISAEVAAGWEPALHAVWQDLPDTVPRPLAELVLGGVQARGRILNAAV